MHKSSNPEIRTRDGKVFDEIWRVAVSRNEKYVLAEGNALELWDLEGDWSACVKLRDEEYRIAHHGAFSGDSQKLLLFAGNFANQVIDTYSLPDFSLVNTTDLPADGARSSAGGLQMLVLSPDGKKIACVRKERDSRAAVVILDAQSGDVQVEWKTEENSGGIYSISWSPDSSRIVVAPANGDCLVFDAETATKATRLDGPDRYSVAFSSDGESILTIGKSHADLVNARTGRLIQKLPGEFELPGTWFQWHPYGRFSNDGKKIIVTSKPPVVWTCE